jgi:hypothetical protein
VTNSLLLPRISSFAGLREDSQQPRPQRCTSCYHFSCFPEIISIVNVYTVLTPINFLSSPYLYLQITLPFITSVLSGRASCARLKVCKVRDCEGWTRKVNRGASYSPIISPPFALSHEHVTRSFPHPQTIHPNLPARC